MKVLIQQLVGEVCMTFDDGQKVFEAYHPAFVAGENVELDFSGTRVFVSQFFNACVGQLLKDFSLEEVRARLKVVGLPAAGVEPLRRSVENAERYYRDPKFKEALDRVLTAQATEA